MEIRNVLSNLWCLGVDILDSLSEAFRISTTRTGEELQPKGAIHVQDSGVSG